MERPLYFALVAATLYTGAHPQFSPNASILLLTLGLALIYLELNRPGVILPGACGLLVLLLATASILRLHPSPAAAIMLLIATILFVLDLLRSTHILIAGLATLALTFALLRLIPGVSPAVALPCGLLLGAGTSLLTRIARRARANKGLDL